MGTRKLDKQIMRSIIAVQVNAPSVGDLTRNLCIHITEVDKIWENKENKSSTLKSQRSLRNYKGVYLIDLQSFHERIVT